MGLLSRSSLLLLLLLLVLLVPAALVSAACSNDDPCVGQPDCTGCDPGALVPDPENCRGFYFCNGDEPSSLPFECGDGQVFNATSRECEEGDSCESCSPAPAGSCTYECPAGEDGFASSPTDCGTYFQCEAGTVVGSLSCDASAPFFDGATCQTNETLCCHCRPYCYEADVGTFVPDPLDCRRYYGCTEPSTIPTFSGTCPDGENFDSTLQGCSATASCSIELACTNVVGADGCIEPFTCLTEGYFAKCPQQCTDEYYDCLEVTGEYQDATTCYAGMVFNPDTHICVDPFYCPY